MLELSLNIEPLLTGMDFYDRIACAADLGFKAVEFWDPTVKDASRIARLAAANKVDIAMCCMKGIFDVTLNCAYPLVARGVEETARAMKEMGCSSMFILAGNVESRADTQKNIIIENLRRLTEPAEKHDIRIHIEPVNSLVDLKGQYLDLPRAAFEILKCVNHPRVRMICDIYHMQVMEGNLIDGIVRNIDLISHFHSAAVPGRKEHFLGENDYPTIIRAIEATGYRGYFGVEYYPSWEDHRKSLEAVVRYLRSKPWYPDSGE
ncbi:MAG: Hydroxypyruvate isomerase [Nitrospirae bacterium]|nr:Hydroxypyruvate isomerase [Nitrospirota bacterium]